MNRFHSGEMSRLSATAAAYMLNHRLDPAGPPPLAVGEHLDRRKLPRERSAKLVVDGTLDDEVRIRL
jgi:hypothetical protein